MSFALVAAIAANRVIGKNNKLPWYIPEDLQHFYQLITNKPVIMGRKTYESIGKPLPSSRNIVLTRNLQLKLPSCEVVHSLDEVLNSFRGIAMIIGGATVYQQFLPLAERMYLTLIEHAFVGDSYFPQWQANEWKTIEESTQCNDRYTWRYLTLQRISSLLSQRVSK